MAAYAHYMYLNLGMALYNGETISVRKAFSYPIGTFIQFLGARYLMYLKFFLGFVLFIIPGLYFLTKYYFAGFTIIDNTTQSIGEDMRLNRLLTHDKQWRLLLVFYLQITLHVLL